MEFPAYIARRYLRSRRHSRFLGRGSVTAIVGIAIGVAVLNVTLAIMNGFHAEMRRTFVENMPMVSVITGSPEGFADLAGTLAAVRADEEIRPSKCCDTPENDQPLPRFREGNRGETKDDEPCKHQQEVTPGRVGHRRGRRPREKIGPATRDRHKARPLGLVTRVIAPEREAHDPSQAEREKPWPLQERPGSRAENAAQRQPCKKDDEHEELHPRHALGYSLFHRPLFQALLY